MSAFAKAMEREMRQMHRDANQHMIFFRIYFGFEEYVKKWGGRVENGQSLDTLFGS